MLGALQLTDDLGRVEFPYMALTIEDTEFPSRMHIPYRRGKGRLNCQSRHSIVRKPVLSFSHLSRFLPAAAFSASGSTDQSGQKFLNRVGDSSL